MNRCPRDRDILASNDVNGYRYYSCERCSGYWIPGGSLHRSLSARGILELRTVPAAGASKLHCPDCQAICDVIVIQGWTLDSCGRCQGVWLDSGEAQRVKNLFPEGSAVVDADERRRSRKDDKALGAFSVVDIVAELFLVVLGQ